ncbi:DNA-3-methyladenine glycosidase [Deinococcus malanensis]|uniref:DNA-3-methyladenine glycosylase II n=2 Tax=Deinococcus malanensis TaxID=1706855 RepID=A0ABQ2EVV2_9DEIO|nr:DNA-3-methyladenine glycosidase [Deinococcus malanensis]
MRLNGIMLSEPTLPDVPLTHHADALAHLSNEPVMAELIALNGDLPVFSPTPDPFGTLVRNVTGQQLSVKAADRIYTRLVEQLGDLSAPSILATTGDDLRAVGLSWAKVRTIQAIAQAAHSGEVDFGHLSSLPDEEIIRELVPLPGIGRWTVEMFLMFALARPNVFSMGDLALRQHLERRHPDQPAAEVLARWAPYRTLAARYIWAEGARSKKGGGAPA